MKCKYLTDLNSVIEVDSEDSYETVQNELAKITNDECDEIVEIKLEMMSFEPAEYSAIFGLLKTVYTPNVNSISLSESSNISITHLKDLIREKEIKELALSNIKFNSQEITELTELFAVNQQLNIVDLHCCDLNDATNEKKHHYLMH